MSDTKRILILAHGMFVILSAVLPQVAAIPGLTPRAVAIIGILNGALTAAAGLFKSPMDVREPGAQTRETDAPPSNG